ncbi:MAG TPA: redox-sensing transcriptional repressor Rex [Candidatus Latescibacteria bacterium]|nr:redox-sensing transcriptional repressor Rex [Candidatus Latescibacterota bacterium]
MLRNKAPKFISERFSLYLRALTQLEESGVKIISSDDLGRLAGGNGALVRKDLSYFGEFGIKGVGYNVSELRREISSILGIDRRWKVIVVGAGHLGSALIGYKGFRERNFEIVAAFDMDRTKIGTEYLGVPIRDIAELPEFVRRERIKIAVVSVPRESAQAVVDLLVSSGIRAILNFAPVKLHVPEDIFLNNVDLSTELESLTFLLTNLGGER